MTGASGCSRVSRLAHRFQAGLAYSIALRRPGQIRRQRGNCDWILLNGVCPGCVSRQGSRAIDAPTYDFPPDLGDHKLPICRAIVPNSSSRLDTHGSASAPPASVNHNSANVGPARKTLHSLPHPFTPLELRNIAVESSSHIECEPRNTASKLGPRQPLLHVCLLASKKPTLNNSNTQRYLLGSSPD